MISGKMKDRGSQRLRFIRAADGEECMDEKRFYDEKEETKQIPLICPHCRQEATYPVRWKVRTKKTQIPPGAKDEDRARFAKARTYMVRVDDMVACRNIKCRKRFELTGQTVILT
jgi:hypothetical protein